VEPDHSFGLLRDLIAPFPDQQRPVFGNRKDAVATLGKEGLKNLLFVSRKREGLEVWNFVK